MAIINVDDAYILNETGAQVDKTTGIPFKNESLTEAEAAQARANIRAGGSNPNLLDNAYFVGGGSQLGDGVFPINQRGQSSYSGGGTAIDRWKTWDGSDTIVLTSTGVKYKSPNSNGIFQYFPVDLPTNALTFSVKIDGVISSVVLPEGQNEARGYGTGFEFLVNRSNKTVGVISGNTELLLQAFKLEVGTVSTLPNDPPPDFGEEMRKCQRYLFIRDYVTTDLIGHGLSVSATFGIINVTLPVSMRSGGSPTGTFSASPLVYGGGTGEQPSFSLNTVVGNTAKFVASMTAGIANTAIVAYAGTNIRMVISSEL